MYEDISSRFTQVSRGGVNVDESGPFDISEAELGGGGSLEVVLSARSARQPKAPHARLDPFLASSRL